MNNFAECNLYTKKGIQYFNKKKEKIEYSNTGTFESR